MKSDVFKSIKPKDLKQQYRWFSGRHYAIKPVNLIQSPSAGYLLFLLFFLKNTLKFYSAGQIAFLSMRPVMDE